jgi:protein-tyrosine phosphatase
MEENERNFRGEPFLPYEPQLKILSMDMSIPVKLMRKPIRDMDIPPVEVMISILDEIDAAVSEGHTVYVHCWGGRGRTGTVVGCYLARHGIAAGEAALDKLQDLRRNDPISYLASPETKIQADMVRNWPFGQ